VRAAARVSKPCTYPASMAPPARHDTWPKSIMWSRASGRDGAAHAGAGTAIIFVVALEVVCGLVEAWGSGSESELGGRWGVDPLWSRVLATDADDGADVGESVAAAAAAGAGGS
jgi:hypothetical protein